MSRHSRIGWLFVGAAVAIGCGQTQPGSNYKTYDQLLTQEPAATEVESTDAVSSEDPGIAAEIAPDPVPDGGDIVEVPVSAIAPVNVVDGTQAASILQVSATPTTPVTPAVAAAPTGPRTIELLVPQKDFKIEGKPPGLRVSYDDLDLLKVLNMEPVPDDAAEHFPHWLRDLNGKQVRIRGFMYPTFESTGIEQFVLARDNQICCFGRDPKVYDLIAVQLESGRTTDYIPNRPFDVVGKFRIEMLAERGKPLGLYWLEDARVIDK